MVKVRAVSSEDNVFKTRLEIEVRPSSIEEAEKILQLVRSLENEGYSVKYNIRSLDNSVFGDSQF